MLSRSPVWLSGLSPPTRDDGDPSGGLPADSRAEDLQVPPAAGGAAQVHGTWPPGLPSRALSRGGHEEDRQAGERAEAQDGEHRDAGGVADVGGRLGGEWGCLLAGWVDCFLGWVGLLFSELTGLLVLGVGCWLAGWVGCLLSGLGWLLAS